MTPTPDIWAALPVKEFANAKQRLSPLLTPLQRATLAAAMLEDVLTALAVLTREGRAGMLILPGDIPRVTAAEINALIAAHRPAPSFTITPAHDEMGSNAVLCLPPEVMPLRFGDNSYFPHLDTARRHAIEPTIVPLPGFALDIDHPDDLCAFLRAEPSMPTRTLQFLHRLGLS